MKWRGAAGQNKDSSLAGDVALAKAIALYRAGRFSDAEKAYKNVVELKQYWLQETVANYGLAMIAWKSDKHDDARSRLKEADVFRESHRTDNGADGWFWGKIVDLAKREADDLIAAEKTEDDDEPGDPQAAT